MHGSENLRGIPEEPDSKPEKEPNLTLVFQTDSHWLEIVEKRRKAFRNPDLKLVKPLRGGNKLEQVGLPPCPKKEQIRARGLAPLLATDP
jgi:hypothetical protein